MSTDKKDVKYDRCEICGLKDICVYDKEKLNQTGDWPLACIFWSDWPTDRWDGVFKR